jgi:hypothetical protein
VGSGQRAMSKIARAVPRDLAGGWRLEAGGWRLEAGGWRLEAGREAAGGYLGAIDGDGELQAIGSSPQQVHAFDVHTGRGERTRHGGDGIRSGREDRGEDRSFLVRHGSVVEHRSRRRRVGHEQVHYADVTDAECRQRLDLDAGCGDPLGQQCQHAWRVGEVNRELGHDSTIRLCRSVWAGSRPGQSRKLTNWSGSR